MIPANRIDGGEGLLTDLPLPSGGQLAAGHCRARTTCQSRDRSSRPPVERRSCSRQRHVRLLRFAGAGCPLLCEEPRRRTPRTPATARCIRTVHVITLNTPGSRTATPWRPALRLHVVRRRLRAGDFRSGDARIRANLPRRAAYPKFPDIVVQGTAHRATAGRPWARPRAPRTSTYYSHDAEHRASRSSSADTR